MMAVQKILTGLITAFGLVSPAFLALHAVYRPGAMPASVDTVEAWALTIAGMSGALATVCAVALSVLVLARYSLSPWAKVFIVGIVLLSVACTIAMHAVKA
jgi:hypothetical protein